MTIEPTPTLVPWPANGRMLGLAMTPPWIRNWSEPIASPMFNVDNVTFVSSVMVLAPKMFVLRFAMSPRSSGKPARAVQLEGAIHE